MWKRLEKSEHVWETKMGAWFPGERVVFRGKDLLTEGKNKRWMELLLFGITGREFTCKQIELFESIWVLAVSFPEPRIWNNRISSFAGTARSTASLGISAGIAVSEAKIYGQFPFVKCADFLFRAFPRYKSGHSLSELIEDEMRLNEIVYGYGRPVIDIDERIVALMDVFEKLGYAEGGHIKLAFAIERELMAKYPKLRMNVAALMASSALDQGLTVKEFSHLSVLAFTAGMFPCYLDALEKPEGSFFPLRCSRINYKGVAPRIW